MINISLIFVVGLLGDMWKYSVIAQQWIWVNGSPNLTHDTRPAYPNPLVDFAHTFDGTDLYIFGGYMIYEGIREP